MQLQMNTVSDDLAACVQRVGQLERMVKMLRNEVDRLREKIRN
jgi:hypothetical protein